MDFPSRLKRLRLQRKMTQEELGQRVNVTKVSISGYENGNRTPDMETLQKLADVFGVSIDYLLGRTNVPIEPYDYNKDPTLEPEVVELARQIDALPPEKRQMILDLLELYRQQKKAQK